MEFANISQFGTAPTTSDIYPPMWVLLASPTILLISVVIATLVFLQNRWAHIRTRRMDTLLRILDVEMSQRYRQDFAAFERVRDENLWSEIADRNKREYRELHQSVCAYLDHYEIVAIGIQRKLLSKTIYKEWIGPIVVRDWNSAKEYIEELSKKQSDTYIEFKWLAQEMEKPESKGKLQRLLTGPRRDT